MAARLTPDPATCHDRIDVHGLGDLSLRCSVPFSLSLPKISAFLTMTVTTHIAARVVRVLPRRSISRLVGKLCDAELPPPISRAVVGAYARAFRVDLTDVPPPSAPYTSLDAFFTRGIRRESRPISVTKDDVVSPADGHLQSVGRVERGCCIVVKNRAYDVAQLIGDEQDARRYVGGQFAVVYLSPRDYHRVHVPVDGWVSLVRALPGDFFPVNALGDLCTRSLLVTNQRVVIVVDTENLGRVTLVMVGAMIVGRITVSLLPGSDVSSGTHRIEPPAKMTRGVEIGAFHLGSTTVVLAESKSSTWHRQPGLIRVGESLVRTG